MYVWPTRHMDTQDRTTTTQAADIDPATQDRLARLANRRPSASGTPVAPRAAAAPTGRTTAPSGRTRKRHAAKASRTAALVMSVATSFGLSAYFHFSDASASAAGRTSATANAASATIAPATTASVTTASVTTASVNTSTGAASTVGPNALADGTYVGSTETNRWGPVQVQISVSGGKIIDVTALQTPSDRGQSVDINNYAAPVLANETLTAQSAKIDTVSGATYTSKSYKASLQSAIDLARAAALKSGAVA